MAGHAFTHIASIALCSGERALSGPLEGQNMLANARVLGSESFRPDWGVPDGLGGAQSACRGEGSLVRTARNVEGGVRNAAPAVPDTPFGCRILS